MKRIKLLTAVFPLLTVSLYAQWRQTSGPLSANITTLASIGKYVYAGSYYGKGVYVSSDNGTNWTALNSNTTLENSYIISSVITVSGSDTNIFFGTGGNGIFLSTNDGASWTAINTGITNYTQIQINCLKAIGNKLYAATSTGIFMSTNNGTNWAFTGSPDTIFDDMTINVKDGDTALFAGSYYGGGVFRYENGTWTNTSSGLPSSIYVTDLATIDTTLFVCVDGYGVYKSTNNGDTWASVSTGISNLNVVDLGVDDTILYVGTGGDGQGGDGYGGGAFRSTDKGNTWITVNTGLTNPNVTCFTTNISGLFASTYGGGVFYSTNTGNTWTAVNSGIETMTQVTYLSSMGDTVAAVTEGGMYLSSDSGSTWKVGFPDWNIQYVTSSGGALFADDGQNGTYSSTDGGSTWTEIISGAGAEGLCILGGTLYTAVYGGGVYTSTFTGSGLTADRTGLTNLNTVGLATNGTDLYAGTYGGGVFLSTDNGASWTAVNTGLTTNGLTVYSIFAKDTTLFIGTRGGLFYSTNNGSSWAIDTAGMGLQAVFGMAVSGNNIFAGTLGTTGLNGNGVYLSTNNGVSWTPVNSGLTNLNVYSLAVAGDNLYAGTYSSGVFVASLNKLTGINNITANPEEIKVYPNPNNGIFNISVTNREQGLMNVQVYNVLGERVYSTPLDFSKEGTPEINISNQPAGTYLYRVITENGELVGEGKLILTK